MIRVAHLVARLPVGGMETVVSMLVDGMPPEQYACEIWCLEDLDQVGVELRSRGIPINVIGRRRQRDPWLFVRLARELKQRRIDILHCHDELAWFYGAVAARMGGRVPVVVTFHGRRRDIAFRHLQEQRLLARLTDRLVSVSETLRQEIVSDLRMPEGRVVHIFNGISFGAAIASAERRRLARAALGLDESQFVVGSVARFSPVKNLLLPIQATGRLHGRIPRFRLVLIGDGPERENLEREVVERHLEDTVLLTGVRRDVADLLPAFDGYVCSSVYEGTSISILEAMAQGIPIIATGVGGNPDLLEHGRCGVLVPTRDADAMARALYILYTNTPDRVTLGRRGHAAVRTRFSLAAMVDGYDGIYRELFGTSDAPAVRVA